jgi:hypothetical protein
MQLKVWWLLGGDNYYPSDDNFIESYLTEKEAYVEKERLEATAKKYGKWYEVINIEGRLGLEEELVWRDED